MSNFAAPYCKRVRYVGILRFHNILSTIMSSLFSWARQPNYLSHALLFCCDHYLLNLMGRFWFFSLSQLVLRCYNIVKTESVLKTENTFKVLFLNIVLKLFTLYYWTEFVSSWFSYENFVQSLGIATEVCQGPVLAQSRVGLVSIMVGFWKM